MRIALGIVAVVLTLVLLAAAAQTHRYLGARRDIVADRQELLYSSSAFHVITVVELAPNQDLLDGMRGLVDAVDGQGGEPIYAGKIAVNALVSRQIPEAEWDAFLLTQYASREAYQASIAQGELSKVRAGFQQSYALGLQRPALLNLGIPIAFMFTRAMDVVRGEPARYPFEAADVSGASEEDLARRDRLVGQLLANREYGKEALVVLNFTKQGTAEEQAANDGYGSAMLAMMAELGIGPMHMGRAVTLEGDADFDSVAIVYYPGVDFFAEMVQSTFFTGISGGKQLGDTLSSPSVPLLPHL